MHQVYSPLPIWYFMRCTYHPLTWAASHPNHIFSTEEVNPEIPSYPPSFEYQGQKMKREWGSKKGHSILLAWLVEEWE